MGLMERKPVVAGIADGMHMVALQQENERLQRLVAELLLKNQQLREGLRARLESVA